MRSAHGFGRPLGRRQFVRAAGVAAGVGSILPLLPTRGVRAMQSTDIFTVGGSISVNAHGMDHQAGALAKSIRSMKVMLADGFGSIDVAALVAQSLEMLKTYKASIPQELALRQ